MLLRRTSYPCRFSDMIPRFPRPVSVLSLITNGVMDFIYDNEMDRGLCVMDTNGFMD